MKQDILDTKGKVIDKIELPEDLFGLKENPVLVSQVVTSYLSNKRKGIANTKTRGEVAGSTRKIFRQKGTGKARAGSIRSPIRVGGGIVFGPKSRDFSKKITKQAKKKTLFITLSTKLRDKKIQVIDGLEKIEPKTKQAEEVLKNIYAENFGKIKTLLVTDVKGNLFTRAIRNIPYVKIQKAHELNALHIVSHTDILFTKTAVQELIEERAGKIKRGKGNSK